MSQQSSLLVELEPVVAANLDRHLSHVKEWHPHDYIPWSDGKNFAFLGGEDWTPEQSRLDESAKVAMIVNLLTEDNLPSYHREISTRFGRGGAWGTWVGQWTAEENRHGIALRDYLVVTRAVDPVVLERARMAHMVAGYNSGDKTSLEGMVYVTFQELATRVSHRNTGIASGDPIARSLFSRIAADENLHMLFYRNLVAAAFELAPGPVMRAVADELNRFQMPGADMSGFIRKAKVIADAGIFDLHIYLEEVVRPTLRAWGVFEMSGLDAQAEQAREEIARHLATLEARSARLLERRKRASFRSLPTT